MERLTNERFAEIIRNKAICEFCEDCGDDEICVNCEKVNPATVGELRAFWEELTSLVKARDEGRVVVLPCRVGENVYYIFPNCGGYLGYFISEPYKVTEVGTKGFWTSDILDEQPDAMSVFTPWSDFGKTVFFTRAEAEAALSGGECT